MLFVCLLLNTFLYHRSILENMETLYYCIKVQLPGYLESLPLPKSFGGFATLTSSQWLQLLPFFIFNFIFLCILLSPILFATLSKRKKFSRSRVNEMIKMNKEKIVDTFDIEDIGDKKSFCRCWKSLTVVICNKIYYGCMHFRIYGIVKLGGICNFSFCMCFIIVYIFSSSLIVMVPTSSIINKLVIILDHSK